MPIVDPDIIKSGENKLLASILGAFDEYQIEKLFQKIHRLNLREKMHFKGGKTVVFENQIAYKMDYSSVAAFPVLINEIGKFMGFANSPDIIDTNANETEAYEKILDSEVIRMRKAEFLESICASININTIAELFKKIYDLKTIGKVIYSSGDIKTLSGHVVYQLVYDIELFFSIMIDREGNFIGSSIKDSGLKRKMDELPELDIV